MKRFSTIMPALSVAIILTVAVSAFGATPSPQQTMSYVNDIYNLSVNDYYGTARTLGMGNAVTATGGELGCIPFNPAGGAVSHYSEVSITPGVSISTTGSHGVASADGNTYLGSQMQTGQTRFILPNGGFNINFDMPYNNTLKGFSFGIVANMSRNFNGSMTARGTNAKGTSSFAGSLASEATDNGFSVGSGSLLDLAWRTDVIGNLEQRQDNGIFFGINEWMDTDGSKRAYLEGDISQRFSNRTTGNKEDFIFNFAFNLRDMIYLGASLGIVSLSYSMTQSFYECYNPDTCDPSQFHTLFNELSWGYNYGCSGCGVYGKFGIIAAPVAGLRLGVAIQTPTGYSISESYGNNVSNTCNDKIGTLSESYNYRDIRYKITSPMRVNAGIAYTFDKFAVLSADYEYVNYGQSRYRAVYAEDEVWFEPVNDQIQGLGKVSGDCLGASHLLRVGAEVKPVPSFAIRLGYNLTTDGTYYKADTRAYKNINAVTFGLGWTSQKSFFVDLAARWTMSPEKYYHPYSNYSNRSTIEGENTLIGGPVVWTKQDLITVMLTLGWKF